MVKIAISGKVASGKTSLANEILEFKSSIGEEYHIHSFAGPIKKIAHECFSMSLDPNLKDRKLLQDIGQKLRDIDPNVWVNAFINQIGNIDNVICDDLRFENEANALKKAGFTLVRLDICKDHQIDRLKRTYPLKWKEHTNKLNNVSETNLDDYNGFDIVVKINRELTDVSLDVESEKHAHKQKLSEKVFEAIARNVKVVDFNTVY